MKHLITATAGFGLLAMFTPNDFLQTVMIVIAGTCGLMTLGKGLER